MRYGNPDGNQKAIVKTFEQLGCTVKNVTLISGFCDLIVTRKGKIFQVEVKNLTRKQTDTTQKERVKFLTSPEKEYHEASQAPVWIVATSDEAIELITKGKIT